MRLDDIETDTIHTTVHSIDQIADLVGDGQTITCSKLEIETKSGTIVAEPIAAELEIRAVADESSDSINGYPTEGVDDDA